MPLQNLEGAGGSERIEREVKQHTQEKHDEREPGFQAWLAHSWGFEYKLTRTFQEVGLGS